MYCFDALHTIDMGLPPWINLLRHDNLICAVHVFNPFVSTRDISPSNCNDNLPRDDMHARAVHDFGKKPSFKGMAACIPSKLPASRDK